MSLCLYIYLLVKLNIHHLCLSVYRRTCLSVCSSLYPSSHIYLPMCGSIQCNLQAHLLKISFQDEMVHNPRHTPSLPGLNSSPGELSGILSFSSAFTHSVMPLYTPALLYLSLLCTVSTAHPYINPYIQSYILVDFLDTSFSLTEWHDIAQGRHHMN